ncbi:hypothetical protein Dda_9253 [Drechslerella dactyloides]|uniref:Uncharacterized protein n=1 Tax=Drechslerella dactyloides TaxID=74499 RepID=A0AAD6IS05_DREDA|nr:hypothetical protein Dda_9253 [Drechslerella dactyloides]
METLSLFVEHAREEELKISPYPFLFQTLGSLMTGRDAKRSEFLRHRLLVHLTKLKHPTTLRLMILEFRSPLRPIPLYDLAGSLLLPELQEKIAELYCVIGNANDPVSVALMVGSMVNHVPVILYEKRTISLSRRFNIAAGTSISMICGRQSRTSKLKASGPTPLVVDEEAESLADSPDSSAKVIGCEVESSTDGTATCLDNNLSDADSA